jgi:hypothetical protein
MKKQTAVEWLIEQIHPTISESLSDVCIKELIEIAKEKEKEQMIDAIRYGFFMLRSEEDAEQCYTSNYE